MNRCVERGGSEERGERERRRNWKRRPPEVATNDVSARQARSEGDERSVEVGKAIPRGPAAWCRAVDHPQGLTNLLCDHSLCACASLCFHSNRYYGRSSR